MKNCKPEASIGMHCENITEDKVVPRIKLITVAILLHVRKVRCSASYSKYLVLGLDTHLTVLQLSSRYLVF